MSTKDFRFRELAVLILTPVFSGAIFTQLYHTIFSPQWQVQVSCTIADFADF